MNPAACALSLFYQQTYANFYYLNSSAVLQTDAVLERYGDASPSHLLRGGDRARFGRRLTSVPQGYIQDDESLFLRGSPFAYLIDYALVVAALTAALWACILVGRCAGKAQSGRAAGFAVKLFSLIDEGGPIALLAFSFNEVTLYGLASLKIAFTKYSSSLAALPLALSLLLLAYYLLYLLRLLLAALRHVPARPLRALYACF